jgi:hypothetical protein
LGELSHREGILLILCEEPFPVTGSEILSFPTSVLKSYVNVYNKVSQKVSTKWCPLPFAVVPAAEHADNHEH